MEFTHEFTIPVGIDEALDVLTDLERVAPCMPGAVLEEVDGDTYSGRCKVKVGPMSLTYAGDATVTEVDRENHTARIEAAGREKRGAGTANADVAADLAETAEGTLVKVVTDINITGKPASFGRGVMADVGGKIIERFADNLRDMLTEEQLEDQAVATGAEVDHAPAGADADAAAATMPAGAPTTTEPPASTGAAEGAPDPDPTTTPVAGAPAGAATAGGGPRKVTPVAPRDEALDLMDVAGEATLKRVAPVLAALAALAAILWIVRRDS